MTGGKKVRKKNIFVNTPVEQVIRTFNGQVVDTATPQTTPLQGPRRGRTRPAAPGPLVDVSSLGISAHISPKCGVVFYPKGVQTIAVKRVTGKNGGARGDRGEVTSFSPHSRGRLRRVLMSWQAPDGWIVGAISLTVPGPVVDNDTFRQVFYAWSLKVVKTGLCAVWRIELQTRGMPHVHATLWGKNRDAVRECAYAWGDCVKILGPVSGDLYADVKDKNGCFVAATWVSHRMGLAGASSHAVDFNFGNDDMPGWWRYICDHSSKGKKGQLGWKGRQWGIIGRARFSKLAGVPEWLTAPEFARVLRVIRRLRRPADPLKRKFWKRGRLRGVRGCSDWFCRPDTMRRAIEWARSESVNQQGAI